MSRYIFTTMLCSAITMSFGQNKIKQYNVIRTSDVPKIDGKPFEKIWKSYCSYYIKPLFITRQITIFTNKLVCSENASIF
jgi:hypothetical protein